MTLVPKVGADGSITFVDVGASEPAMAVAAPEVSTGTTAKLGYTYDPYDSPGEHVEGFFLGKIFGKFTGESDGFISTYREWHIFVQGLYAGFRGKTFGDVPECPPLWLDEAQYFEGAAMFANVIKCNWIAVLGVIAAGGVGVYTGIIPSGTVNTVASNLMSAITSIV